MEESEITFCPFCYDTYSPGKLRKHPMQYTLFYDGELKGHRFQCQDCGADILLDNGFSKQEAIEQVKKPHRQKINLDSYACRVRAFDEIFRKWKEPFKTVTASILATGTYSEISLRLMLGDDMYNKAFAAEPEPAAKVIDE